MRSLARLLVPWLAALALLAWGASALLNVTARSWYERDVSLRARLAVAGARDALISRILQHDHRQLTALVEEIARDDRILAAEVCDSAGSRIASTARFPAKFACDMVGAAGREGASGGPVADFRSTLNGSTVHVTAVRIGEDEAPVGTFIVVHDMSFVARREAAMRQVTVGVFAAVAVLASILTVALRRMSWADWTRELHSVLTFGRRRDERSGSRPHPHFQPLIADLREAVAELARESTAGGAGRWSPARLHRTLSDSLEGEGVIVVANREPYIHEQAPDGGLKVVRPASGLVTALEPVMRACSGTWIAHGSGSGDRAAVDRHDRIRVPPGHEAYTLRRVWLSREEERGYYYGFSNEGLWPLCHIAHARPVFRVEDWRHYQLVNERFADAVCEEVSSPDAVVLVQDYHFALLPALLRKRIPRATIISFWHIPWPNAEGFGICPWGREILTGLLGSSVVGFHTQLHCNNFIESIDRYLEARIDREDQSIVLGGRRSLVRNYPISIEWPNGFADAAPSAAECRASVFDELGLAPGAFLGVGVDRLDYTKGIEERLLAVERALERFPHLRGRFTFVQLAAPSRTVIERYRALNTSVEEIAARINARYEHGLYRPIVLLRRHHEPAAVFRFLRAADVCYVSSLHDGMNLVAKEFVAARSDERGVLVLSRFTGAARELGQALIVNPYDLEEASAALATALAMSPAEQCERMRAMRNLVAEMNVYRWAGKMLQDAARVRQHGRVSNRLSLGFRTISGGEP
jgi:trehalose 6-phosphate synthase